MQRKRSAIPGPNSGNFDDVRHYVTTVTNGFISPGPIKDLIDDRATSLHLKYLAESLPSVSEETLVAALNYLGDQIGMPEYGKTNSLEFRLLRMRILQLMPELNPTALTQLDESVTAEGKHSKTLHSAMRPVEIAYLVCSLTLQKRINPIAS